MKSIQLWLVRHGQTLENIQKVLCGQNPGTLTELGMLQAEELGKRLAKETFYKAYTSDLDRVRKTYQIISAQFNIKPQFEELALIREKNNGVLDFKSLDYPKQLAAEQKIDIRYLQPENGERWVDVNERAQKFLDLIARNHLSDNEIVAKKQMENILAVTHGGFIRETMNFVRFKNDNVDPIYKASSFNCSITILELSKTKVPYQTLDDLSIKILLENDDQHCKHLK